MVKIAPVTIITVIILFNDGVIVTCHTAHAQKQFHVSCLIGLKLEWKG